MAKTTSRRGGGKAAKTRPAKKAKGKNGGNGSDKKPDPWAETFELLSKTTISQAAQYARISKMLSEGTYGSTQALDEWLDLNQRGFFYWTELTKIWWTAWPSLFWPYWWLPRPPDPD